MDDRYEIQDQPSEPGPLAPVAPTAARRGRSLARIAAIGGSLLIGAGAVAAVVVGPAAATDGGALMQLANTAGSTTPTAPDTTTGSGWGRHGMGPGMGGMLGANHEAVDDLQVAATAIGISVTDLRTALQSGQTLAQVATSKGVAIQTVVDALVADQQKEIDAAVSAGRITQAQADTMKANLTQMITDRVNGTFGGPGRMGEGRGWPGAAVGRAEDVTVVAKAIGISDTDLVTALRSGKSIADVAKSKSVAVQTVIDALVAAEKAEISAAVSAGRLTQAQADKLTANLTQRVTDLVNGTFPGRGMGPGMGHGFGRGFGGGWGHMGGFGPDSSGGTSPSTNSAPSAGGPSA